MGEYLEVIKSAIFFFPILAFLITIPYILHQYHKYGSIYYVRVLIVYSFVLYLLTAYFLVILPLPTMEEVANLTTARVQLVPFAFVGDFIRESSFQITQVSTYLKALTEPCFYVVAYNVLLTLPFGLYLRYYFNCSRKKAVFLTFCLSLFFEVTQLTGLYFIYSRGYRLFDVDDLIVNTFGGMLGVFTADLCKKFLPSREKIDEVAYQLGKKVSFLRRVTCFFLDSFLFLLLYIFLSLFIRSSSFLYIFFLFYYVFLPFFLKGSTLAQKFLNLRLTSTKSERLRFYQIFLYYASFYFLYFFFPYWMIRYGSVFFSFFQLPSTFILYFYIIGFIGYFLVCLISILFVMMKKPLFYERFSSSKLTSTILNETCNDLENPV